MSGCGSCTLCCDLMRVQMEPVKEARTSCAHCTKKGCSIYEDRPEPCRDFECLWLASNKSPEMAGAMPRDMRPDKSGVVMEVNTAALVVAHCKFPESYKRGNIGKFLRAMAQKQPVLLELGGRCELLKGDGTTEPLVRVGVNEETNEVLYRRAIHAKAAELLNRLSDCDLAAPDAS